MNQLNPNGVMEKAFPVKGRYVILIWIITIPLLPGLDYLYQLMNPGSAWYWFDVATYYYSHFLMLLLTSILVIINRLDWKKMFNEPSESDFVPAIKLTVFTYLFSMAALYAVFYPLSYIFPEFVKTWLIDIPPIIYAYEEQFYMMGNLMGLISLVIIGPALEEFTFRGLLLHRWSQKWGVYKGMLVSSIFFGLLHPDPLGAAVFGYVMCIIYLKTQTLWVPIICHGLYNLFIWLIDLGFWLWLKEQYFYYTLDDFRSGWIYGAIAGLFVVIWVWVYLRREKNKEVLILPSI